MEQGQQEDGSIEVPPVLAPYMGGLERIASPGRERMSLSNRESGRALVGLLLVNLGLLGVLALLLVGNRAAEKTLRGRLAEMDRVCSGLKARQEEMTEEAARTRLELAEAAEGRQAAETLLAEAREKLATFETDLARVSAERDEHLAARLNFERKLADALNLIASRGE